MGPPLFAIGTWWWLACQAQICFPIDIVFPNSFQLHSSSGNLGGTRSASEEGGLWQRFSAADGTCSRCEDSRSISLGLSRKYGRILKWSVAIPSLQDPTWYNLWQFDGLKTTEAVGSFESDHQCHSSLCLAWSRCMVLLVLERNPWGGKTFAKVGLSGHCVDCKMSPAVWKMMISHRMLLYFV